MNLDSCWHGDTMIALNLSRRLHAIQLMAPPPCHRFRDGLSHGGMGPSRGVSAMPNLRKIPVLTGMRFGMLVALEEQKKKGGGYKYLCRCDCGNITTVFNRCLYRGLRVSCGCAKWKKTHGCSKTRAYKSWDHMLDRCKNPKTTYWNEYGGRGIKVCERWMKFENFLADMGERPEGTSIDRINNNGNYEPENCRWATKKQQQQNRRVAHKLTHDGTTMTLSEWSRRAGLKTSTLSERLRRGMGIKDALTKSVGPNGRRLTAAGKAHLRTG